MSRLFRLFLSFTLVTATLPAWSKPLSASPESRAITMALNNLQNSQDAGAMIEAMAANIPATLRQELLAANMRGLALPKFERDGDDIVLTDGSTEVRISVEMSPKPTVLLNGVALKIDERTSLADLQGQIVKVLNRSSMTSKLWNLVVPQAHADGEVIAGIGGFLACFGMFVACAVILGVVGAGAAAYYIYHEATRPACDSAAKDLIGVLTRTRTDHFEILACGATEQKALLVDKRLIGSDLFFTLVANEKGQSLERWKPKYHGLADGYTFDKRYTGFTRNHDGKINEISYIDAKNKPQVMRASDVNSGRFADEVKKVSSFLQLVESKDLDLKDACGKCDNDVEKLNAQIRERKSAR